MTSLTINPQDFFDCATGEPAGYRLYRY